MVPEGVIEVMWVFKGVFNVLKALVELMWVFKGFYDSKGSN